MGLKPCFSITRIEKDWRCIKMLLSTNCNYYSDIWCNATFSIIGLAITLTLIIAMIIMLFKSKEIEIKNEAKKR